MKYTFKITKHLFSEIYRVYTHNIFISVHRKKYVQQQLCNQYSFVMVFGRVTIIKQAKTCRIRPPARLKARNFIKKRLHNTFVFL